MRQLNRYILILMMGLMTVPLAACGTGGGYSGARPWEVPERTQTPARQDPRTIADNMRLQAETGAESEQAAQSQPAAAPAAPDMPTVRVALLLPLSGEHEALGQAMLRSAQMALFDSGHSAFNLIPRDTKGTPQGAREAAQDALRENVDLILGPVFSDSVNAVSQATRGTNVNIIAFSTDWTMAGGNTFIMGLLPFDQVERVVRYASENGYGDFGIIAPRTNYGRAVLNAYQSVAQKTGLPPAKVMQFSPRTSNLAPDVRRFTLYDQRREQAKAQNISPAELVPFETVLLPVGGDKALSIANLISHYDLPPDRVKRLGTGLFDDPGLANEAGLDGAWFAAPSPRLRETFEQRFQNLYGYPPPRLSTLSYDAAALAAILARRGLQSQGRPAYDRQSLLNPNGFSGLDGIFRFHPGGTTERGLAILEFRNGRIRIEDPAPKTFVDMMRY